MGFASVKAFDIIKQSTAAKPFLRRCLLPALIMLEIIKQITVTKPFLPAFATVPLTANPLPTAFCGFCQRGLFDIISILKSPDRGNNGGKSGFVIVASVNFPFHLPG